MAAQATRRVTDASSSVAPEVRRYTLADIAKTGHNLPNRWVLYACEGWGKTSLAAHFPAVIFLQSKGETGLQTLIDAGQLQPTSHFPDQCESWSDVLSAIDFLQKEEHSFKAIAIDTINGVERLCFDEVCRREFSGNWGEKGFMGFQRGFEVACNDWRLLLSKLDTLRETRRMTVVCMCHMGTKNTKNPSGPDYDRFSADMDKRTWALTHRWADNVLYGNFETFVETDRSGAKRGKASGQARMLYCVHRADYDAKNRLGLPPEIVVGETPDDAWKNFSSAVKAARKSGLNNNNSGKAGENNGG